MENNLVDYLEIFGDGLVLTSLFWDCECDQDYIHPAAIAACEHCGSVQDDQPISHANEVLLLCPELLSTDQHRTFVDALKRVAHLKTSGYWPTPPLQ
jgi:hypothetical protein